MSNTDITNIETSDTFQIWFERTNDLIDLANENVMLAGPLGFTVEGNSTLTGTFTANTLVADSEFILPIGTTAERPSPLIGSLRFNTDLETFEGYDGENWGEIGGAGSGLGNPIFINDNYNAEINDYIIADSTAASFSIILPASPEEGDIIRVATVSAQTNNIIIAGNGNTFEDSLTDLIVNVDFIILDLVFNSNTWRVFSNFGLGPDVSTKIETDTTTNEARSIAFTEETFGETDTLFVSIDDLSFNPATKTLSTTNFEATGNTSVSTLTVTGNTSVSTLTVTGNTSLANTSVSTLTVTGNTSLANTSVSTLTVTGNTALANTSVSTLTVTGNTALANTSVSTLDVTGNTTLANTSISEDLLVIGEVTAGSLNSLSDATFKKEINPIESALSVIDQLSGVEFEWKKDSKKSAGVIAQELERVLPHAVSETNGTKSVNYNVIIAYLIEAIKELKNNK